MPITSSAKKALSASKRKHVFNVRRKSEIEKKLKEFRKFVDAKDRKGAEKMISTLYKTLDKAVKTDYIKANRASRLKSRAMLALNKIK